MLYPLKFHSIFKEKIWGGEKIKTILKKDFSPLNNCGESWELSGIEGNISKVKGGPHEGKDLKSLISEYKEDLIGSRIYDRFRDEFPLLIKFIDSNEDLSIQVHPDDKLAKSRHNSFGKTEMWYIIQADNNASLISGFNRSLNRQIYIDHVKQGRLLELLNKLDVYNGDVFYIPAGRVHTIGKGLLLAEIQQTSDVTYRIYDFDRVDKLGKKRELHLEDSLNAIDYRFYEDYKTIYKDKTNQPVQLISCDYFTTNKIKLDRYLDRDYQTLDSFIALICVEGAGMIGYSNGVIDISLGDVILIPAKYKNITLKTELKMTLLETYVTR